MGAAKSHPTAPGRDLLCFNTARPLDRAPTWQKHPSQDKTHQLYVYCMRRNTREAKRRVAAGSAPGTSRAGLVGAQ